MDLTDSIAPKSDQINAEDLLTGPRTVTVEKVTAGSAEQPFNFHLRELPGRPYRPSKTMRRVIVNAWGPDASTYAGKRLTLYRDPEVTFGRDKVGGIKISAMSGIGKPVTLALTVTRGRRAPHTVQPLTEPSVSITEEPSPEQVAASADPNELRAFWDVSGPERREQIKARVAELKAAEQ